MKIVRPFQILVIWNLIFLTSNAQTAAKYPLSITSGIYTSISGTGTIQPDVLISDSCVRITGLTPGFTINGVTYSNAVMHNDGYILLYTGSYTLLPAVFIPDIFFFNGTPIMAPFFTNLGGSSIATSEAYFQTIGAEHIFEWKNFSRVANGDDILNFQVRLNTSTNEVKFMYGNCIQGTGTTGPIVAWKSSGTTWASDINALYQNEYGSPVTCDWSHAVTAQNFSLTPLKMFFNATNPLIKPNSGLTYTWTPQNVVSPVRTFQPVTNITGVGATINWTAPSGATQYNIQYRFAGTSCLWTNWSGNPISTNSVTLTGLLQNTKYQVRVQAVNGSNHTIYSHSPDVGGLGITLLHGYTPNGTFTTLQLPCSGIPNPGNTLVSNLSPCPGTQVTLSLQNASLLGTGVSYQWYNNAGIIPGATNQSLVYTINTNDDFYCEVTCGGNTNASTLVSVTLSNPYNCTCTSTALNTSQADIYQVSIAGATINPIYTNGNGCSTPAPGSSSVLHKYSNFKILGSLTSVTQGDMVPFEIRINECDGAPYYANGVALWIDYNQNGLFTDLGETIYIESTTTSCSGTSPAGDKIVSGSFQIPYSALTGQTAIRVICAEGISGFGLTPCLSYNNGETEDYLINIQQALPCSGTPNPGNTIASSNAACVGSSVVFSLQNQPSVTGLTYQWFNNGTLVTGATNSTYSNIISNAMTVHCAVSCSGGLAVLSNPVNITLNSYLNCYCTPNSQSGTSSGYYGWISNVNFGFISNLSSFPANAPFYTNYNPTGTTSTAVLPGNSYPITVTINSGYSKAAVWFDWNQNGIFDTSEYTFLGVDSSSVFPFTFSQLITVPAGIPAGQIKMRIRSQNYGFGLNSTNACSLLEYGESEDYVITVSSSLFCSGNPNPGNTLASSTLACYGSTVNFSLQNQTPGVGVVYQWHNDTGSVVGSGPYYSQVMTAADHIYCVVKCAFGSVLVASNTVFVNIDTSSACFCIPNTQFGTSSGNNAWISDVEFGSISNTSSFPVAPPYYTNYPPTAGTSANLSALNAYPLEVTLTGGHSQAGAWFDWDQNGVFDSSEYIFLGSNASSTSPVTFSQLISIPMNAPAGLIRMRIRSQKDIFPINANSACSLLEFGESEDYTIAIDAIALCATSMGGYFTINQTIPSGGNNFSSFAEAVNHLTCGINGPVTLSVVPGTGPYNEQVYIPEIPGASSINTVTILGNNEELIYGATQSYAPYTLMFDGSDYFRVSYLKVNGSGITYAMTCRLGGGADNNIFSNCLFISSLNGTNSNQVAFSINLPGGSNNIVKNCTIVGGREGVLLEGGTANTVKKCSILDAGIGFSLTSQNGTVISENTIERTSASQFVGGIGCTIGTGCINTHFEKNVLRNFFTPCPACFSVGTGMTGINVIATASLGNENVISNNLISTMNKSNGIFIGIDINNASYTKLFHNTISFDDSTFGGNGSGAGTVGIRCTGNFTGVEVKNNLISIGRGGLSSKYCVLFFPQNGINCNNNLYYMHSISGTANFIGGTTPGASLLNYLTLGAWQSANFNMWDQQSMSINPGFQNTNDFHPLNSLVDNKGVAVGITTDINGAPRDPTSPDVGCYEFTIFPIDLGISTFISPDTSGCYDASTPVSVTLKNFGYSYINFALNPATISVNVSGVVNTQLSTILSSGTLAPGASMVVILPSLNMTANGMYLFNPYVTIAGDTNQSNDTISSPIIRYVGPVGGSISSVPSSICVSATPTLFLHNKYGGSIQWQQSTSSNSGPWSNVGSGGLSYTPSSPVIQTTWYRTQVSCNGNIAFSQTYTLTVNDPHVVSTTNGSRCGYGPVTLSASGSGSSILKWYENATDNIPLATGNIFITPNINSNTNYFVTAAEGVGGIPMFLENSTPLTTQNNGFLFDMKIFNPVRIDSLSLKASTPGTIVQLYYRPGSGVGHNTSSAGWTLLGTATINTITLPVSVVPLNINLDLDPGLYSFAVKTNFSVKTSIGTAVGNINVSDSNIQIKEGYGGSLSGAFDFHDSTKVWNGILRYTRRMCESPKTMVSATITPPPSILLSAGTTSLCPGNSTTISVTSPSNPNYSYSWLSYPGSFTAIGSGPFVVSPTTTLTYTVIATDNSSGSYAGCGNLSTITINTGSSLSGGNVSSTVDTICTAGIPVLTVSGATGGAIQWQASTNGSSGPWVNVGTGIATYIPASPVNQNTWFRVVVSCQGTNAISNVHLIVVSTPGASILSANSDTTCGGNSCILNASSTLGTIPHWYDSPTGGLLVGIGNSFITPPLVASTNYYVSALPGNGGSTTMVMPPENATTSATLNTEGYWFTSPSSFTITGVNVPSSGSLIGTTQSIAIVKFNGAIPPPSVMSGGTNNFTTLFLTQLNSDTSMIVCNISITAGDVIGILGQRSGITSQTAIVSGPYSIALAGTPIDFYPLKTYNGIANNPPINLGDNLGGSSSRLGRIEFEYNMEGCDEIRTPVMASVIPAPSVAISNSSPVICEGNSSVLQVSSTNDPNYSYTWVPGFMGGSSVTVTPTMTTVYTLLAVDNTTGSFATCSTQGTTTVIVTPAPVTPLITASSSIICQGDNTSLSVPVTIPSSYCIAGSQNGCNASLPGYYISNVNLGSINNSSVCNVPGISYTDFTTVPAAMLTAGTNNPISVTVPVPHSWDDIYVWIDYDHDGVFNNNLEETILVSGTLSTSTVTSGNIFVPVNALNGPTRMRIRLNNSGNPAQGAQGAWNNACGFAMYGEVEDYTVNIIGGLASPFNWSPLTYLSSTFGNSVNATSMNFSTTYTVTSTNVYGCTKTATKAIIVKPNSSSLSSITIPCGNSYTWNGTTYTSSGIYTYSAINSVGCDSIATLNLTIQCVSTLNLTCFIEGYWNGVNQMLPVLSNQFQTTTLGACDTIEVELHDANSPYVLIASTKTILNQNGIATCTFPPLAGYYYIAVRHRNALQTWSANPLFIGSSGATYNFTTAANKAYGSNQKEVQPGVWAFYSGDIYPDENIDLLDLNMLDNAIMSFQFGYFATDINGDGNIDLLDSPVLESNINNFIFSNHP